MNILFLIGNGFDLNIGLNTRFQNALSYYLKKSNNNPRTQKFKKDIDKNFEKWSDFENQMGIYTKEFTPKKLIEKVNEMLSNIDSFKFEGAMDSTDPVQVIVNEVEKIAKKKTKS